MALVFDFITSDCSLLWSLNRVKHYWEILNNFNILSVNEKSICSWSHHGIRVSPFSP